jgi:outer membrane protein assembly factor BamB
MTARWRRLISFAVPVLLGAATWAVIEAALFLANRPTACLQFTSTDRTLTAELLPLEGEEAVVPPFRIKGSEPFYVRPGSYQLRATARGWLSQTRQVDAAPGNNAAVDVLFIDTQVWPPFDLPEGGEVIALDGRHDVIEYTAGGVRRLHGATAKPVWDVRLDDVLEKAGVRWDDVRPRPGEEQPRLAQHALDLDGDGRDDLVWLGRTTPVVLAQSGRDGSLLWAHRAGDRGHVPADPLPFDLDGVPALLVTFLDDDRCRLDALRRDTGALLWRADLDPTWFRGRYLCEVWPDKPPGQVRRTYSGFPAAVVRRDGRPVVALLAGGTFVELDARTGERLGEPLPLDRARPGKSAADSGVTFDGEPLLGAVFVGRFVALDGDEPDTLLTLRWSTRGFDVTALSLKTRQVRWETSLEQSLAWWFVDLDWPRAYRDADGSTTVLVHDGSTASQCVLVALDGATGRPRWKRRLPIDPAATGTSYRLDRFIVGPDLDGDGRRDIFVATLGMPDRRDAGQGHYLFVDALSGADGTTLWTTRLRQPGPIQQEERRPREVRPLAWWKGGDDGWPLLLVPVRRAESDTLTQPMTYVLAAGTGRVAEVITGVDNPRVADLDGDGVPDLIWDGWTEKGRWFDTAHGAPQAVSPMGRVPPRIDVWVQTPLERFAEVVRLYHLDFVALLALIAVGLFALIRRHFFLAGAVVGAVWAAAGVQHFLAWLMPTADCDPRFAGEPIAGKTVSQVVALAGVGVLAVLLGWGLWHILRGRTPSHEAGGKPS